LSDARDLLRRYLEQRRELGETELILDTMPVSDVMRLIGASGRGASRSVPAPKSDVPQRHAGSPDESPPKRPAAAEGRPEPETGGNTSDWRAVLAAAEPPNVAPPPAVAVTRDEDIAALDSIEAIAAAATACRRCPLYATATNAVPGEGNPQAGFMVVGEAPGATEDETGRPFVGAAGQLLTKILAAINLSRDDVFIANVLKHRPPGNRNPLPSEVAACSPYLLRQIELVRPRVILALGTFAAQTLLQTKLPIGQLRAQVHQFHGVPLVATYHPAALLRNPNWRRPTWEDVQLARRVLDSSDSTA
jgi:uracil-DNA glycosylase